MTVLHPRSTAGPGVPGLSRSGRSASPVPVLLICLSACVIAVVGWSLASGPGGPGPDRAAWFLNLLVSVALAVGAAGRAAASGRGGGRPSGTGTLVVSTLALASVTIPAVTLVWRARTAVVERLLGMHVATPETLATALNVVTLSLIAFAIGEQLADRARPFEPVPEPAQRRSWRGPQLVMLTVGLLAYLAQSGGDRALKFATRGEATGQGLLSMAMWSLPLAIACAVLFKHWGSRPRLVASAMGVALIVASGVRSPLVLIAVAGAARLLCALAGAKRPGVVVIGGLLAANVLIAVGTSINVWRGSIRHGRPVSLMSAIGDSAGNPFKALTSAGVDTVDGLLFVQRLPLDSVQAGPADLLKAFVSLVPRQIYPGKPEFLSNVLSEEYLGFGTAGMFLSGPGYLRVIAGSWIAAVLLFGVGGAVYARIAGVRFGGVGWVVATYVLIRFFMGGDAYDFFQGFQLILVLLLARVGSRVAGVLFTRGPAGRQGRPVAPPRRTNRPMEEATT